MASIKLKGDTSGELVIEAPAVAGTNTLTLPASTDTIPTTTQVHNSLGVRNLIINGDMQIAQRSTSVAGITSSGYHTCDRYNMVISAAGTWTQSQDTDVPTGQGFSKSFKMACTTADASLAASDYVIIRQKFEGQMLQHLKKGTVNAESLTLSFWVKSNKTGTYVTELYEYDNSRHFTKQYTISSANTWEKKIITFSGDTTGVLDNDNALSLACNFWLAAGTDWSGGSLPSGWAAQVVGNRAVGQVNLADSTSNYINITGIQLEVGDTATPFEHRPYDMELARCQRYYYRVVDGHPQSVVGTGACYTGSTAYVSTPFPVKMRATPSIEVEGATDFRVFAGNGLNNATTVTSWSQTNVTTGMVRIDGLARTTGHACLMDTNISTAKLSWSAEL